MKKSSNKEKAREDPKILRLNGQDMFHSLGKGLLFNGENGWHIKLAGRIILLEISK